MRDHDPPRSGTGRDCKKFKEMVEIVAESAGKSEEKGNKDASDAADLIEKLNVGESKSEEKASEEVSSAADDKAGEQGKPKTEQKTE